MFTMFTFIKKIIYNNTLRVYIGLSHVHLIHSMFTQMDVHGEHRVYIERTNVHPLSLLFYILL